MFMCMIYFIREKGFQICEAGHFTCRTSKIKEWSSHGFLEVSTPCTSHLWNKQRLSNKQRETYRPVLLRVLVTLLSHIHEVQSSGVDFSKGSEAVEWTFLYFHDEF